MAPKKKKSSSSASVSTEQPTGSSANRAPRHSRAPLPASAGSIQRPSTEARFEDLFPDSTPDAAAAAVSSSSGSSSTSQKRKASNPQSDKNDPKRKRTNAGTEQTSSSQSKKASSSSTRAPRQTLNEEIDDGFIFTRMDPSNATGQEDGASEVRQNGSNSKPASSSSSKRRTGASSSTQPSAPSSSAARPLLSDVADGETPVIRRNQAFRTGAPSTPSRNRNPEDPSQPPQSSSGSSRKRPEAESSSSRQALGMGRPSLPSSSRDGSAGGRRTQASKSSSTNSSSSSSRRSSLSTKSTHRRSSLRDGRTPAFPHREIPAEELYRHVHDQMGAVPRLKAVYGWILERGVEEATRGNLEPTKLPETLLPLDVPEPGVEKKKSSGPKGRKGGSNLNPPAPPLPVLNNDDRAELSANTTTAGAFRAVLSAALAKTVSDLTMPGSSMSNVNWIVRAQERNQGSSSSTSKAKHPRNVLNANLVARYEGNLVGLRSELSRWEAFAEDVDKLEKDNQELESKLDALHAKIEAEEAEAEEEADTTSANRRRRRRSDAKGKSPEHSNHNTILSTLESIRDNQGAAWDEAQRSRYDFALSVLKAQPRDLSGADKEADISAQTAGDQRDSAKRRGKRKRTGDRLGEDDADAEDESMDGDPDENTSKSADKELRSAIADAEWKIDRLRSSTHTLAQLDAVSGRYMQAISRSLGDALKEITSSSSSSSLTSSSAAAAADLAAFLRGVHPAAEDAEGEGVEEEDDQGQDLLRSFAAATGGGRATRASRKSAGSAASAPSAPSTPNPPAAQLVTSGTSAPGPRPRATTPVRTSGIPVPVPSPGRRRTTGAATNAGSAFPSVDPKPAIPSSSRASLPASTSASHPTQNSPRKTTTGPGSPHKSTVSESPRKSTAPSSPRKSIAPPAPNAGSGNGAIANTKVTTTPRRGAAPASPSKGPPWR